MVRRRWNCCLVRLHVDRVPENLNLRRIVRQASVIFGIGIAHCGCHIAEINPAFFFAYFLLSLRYDEFAADFRDGMIELSTNELGPDAVGIAYNA